MKSKLVLLPFTWLTLLTTTGLAGEVIFTMDFPGGFDISINGGPLGPSGPISVSGIVDTATPDIYSDVHYGEFPLLSATFTGAGFVNRTVATPLSVVTYDHFGPQMFGFQLTGQHNQGAMGWNGSSSSGDFMANVNDLSTLYPLPYTTSGTSTFWYDALGSMAWTLALGGDTIGANQGAGGPSGGFSISEVPEPSTFALVVLGAAGLIALGRGLPSCSPTCRQR